MKIDYLEVNQPVGTFYLAKTNSDDLINYFYVNRRSDYGGIQRQESKQRIEEISLYCQDPDAAFPTPIILAVQSENVLFDPEEKTITVRENSKRIFEVIDGQHRIEGIKLAKERNCFNCELVIVLMFDLTEEEKAYIFSTINSNQAKVDKSLIYDLFELSQQRSPYKTSHYIGRNMNSDRDSAFYKRLKMLGKKSNGLETLSQGTFVQGLTSLISKKPQKDMIDIKNNVPLEEDTNLVLRSYFIEEKDEVILKLMNNYFGAVKKVFPHEWESSNYILSKTTGYLGLMKGFPYLYLRGLEVGNLSERFFEEIFKKVKIELEKDGTELTSEYFPSGVTGQASLSSVLYKSYFNHKQDIEDAVKVFNR